MRSADAMRSVRVMAASRGMIVGARDARRLIAALRRRVENGVDRPAALVLGGGLGSEMATWPFSFPAAPDSVAVIGGGIFDS
jgi:hypothetical protein